MGLEAATYIDELVVSNPTGLDEVNKGDDHLRLIKSVLINSLGNISGPVLANDVELSLLAGLLADSAELNILDGAVVTTAELNYVSGVTSSIQAQLDAIQFFIDGIFPVGHQIFSANPANPASYGYPGTWSQIAQGRTLIGAGSGAGLTTRVAGTTLGQEDAVVVAHGHSVNDPGHRHTVFGSLDDGSNKNTCDQGNNTRLQYNNSGYSTTGISINNTGSSGNQKNMQPSLVTYIWERTA